TMLIDFDDVSSEVSRLAANLSDDPGSLEVIQNQLQSLYDLQKKHHVDSVPALIEIRTRLSSYVADAESLEEEISNERARTEDLKATLLQLAGTISKRRMAAAPGLIAVICGILKLLGIPDAR